MKKISQTEFDILEATAGLRRGKLGLRTEPVIEDILTLKVGDCAMIEKKDWPVKTTINTRVNYVAKRRGIQNFRLSVRTLKENQGFIIQRVS